MVTAYSNWVEAGSVSVHYLSSDINTKMTIIRK